MDAGEDCLAWRLVRDIGHLATMRWQLRSLFCSSNFGTADLVPHDSLVFSTVNGVGADCQFRTCQVSPHLSHLRRPWKVKLTAM
mmetsp:Transcript_26910/g.36290  ORF Transcript_26910/g.36290 Transcript_26910/m.36290 type:complete len:84 (-) Transcript_26910:42-293(-)